MEQLAAKHFGVQAGTQSLPGSIQEYQFAQGLKSPEERAAFERFALAQNQKSLDPYIKLGAGEGLLKREDVAAGKTEPFYTQPFATKSVAEGTALVDPSTGAQVVAPRPKTSPAPYGATPGAPVPQQLQELGAVESAKETAQQTAKSQVEKAAAQPQAQAALTESLASLNRLEQQAQTLLQAPGLPGITGLSGVFPNYPGGEAANAQAQLETLKSQISFSVLQAMRDASKTGGALGNVTERELEFLQNNLAALNQAQSLEQMKESLGVILQFAQGAKGRIQAAYQQTYPGAAQPGTAPQAPQQPAKPTRTMTRAQAETLARKRQVPVEEVLQRAQAAGIAVQ